MTRTVQLVFAWSGLAALVVALTGFTLAGVFPVPPRADFSAAQTAAFYLDNVARTRAGFMMAGVGLGLITPLQVVIAVQMLRMEGRVPVLTFAQLVLGAITVVALVVPVLVFNVAAYRPDRDPQITQTLTDLGFILFFTPVVPFVLQNLVIGVAVLNDHRSPSVLPRWVGWANLWIGVIFIPAVLAYFFKSGPFAWQGVFVFWLGFAGYAVWLAMMSLTVRQAVLRQHATVTTPADLPAAVAG